MKFTVWLRRAYTSKPVVVEVEWTHRPDAVASAALLRLLFEPKQKHGPPKEEGRAVTSVHSRGDQQEVVIPPDREPLEVPSHAEA